MIFTKDGIKKRYDVQNGKVLCTIQIDGRWVSNPSLEQFKNEGWGEYTPPIPPAPKPYVPSYEELVVMKIHERYSIDDELALLRQRDTKPDEFEEYFNYVEQCKAEAKEEYSLLTKEV